jgi:hypothetical protein
MLSTSVSENTASSLGSGCPEIRPHAAACSCFRCAAWWRRSRSRSAATSTPGCFRQEHPGVLTDANSAGQFSWLLLSPSLPHDLPSLVVGAFKARLAELLLDHLYRLVLADAGRNHNPLLLQLVNQMILRLPLYVFDHVVVICHALNAFTGGFKPPGRSDRLTDPNHPETRP